MQLIGLPRLEILPWWQRLSHTDDRNAIVRGDLAKSLRDRTDNLRVVQHCLDGVPLQCGLELGDVTRAWIASVLDGLRERRWRAKLQSSRLDEIAGNSFCVSDPCLGVVLFDLLNEREDVVLVSGDEPAEVGTNPAC